MHFTLSNLLTEPSKFPFLRYASMFPFTIKPALEIINDKISRNDVGNFRTRAASHNVSKKVTVCCVDNPCHEVAIGNLRIISHSPDFLNKILNTIFTR